MFGNKAFLLHTYIFYVQTRGLTHTNAHTDAYKHVDIQKKNAHTRRCESNKPVLFKRL